jgi:hypothetical protein
MLIARSTWVWECTMHGCRYVEARRYNVRLLISTWYVDVLLQVEQPHLQLSNLLLHAGGHLVPVPDRHHIYRHQRNDFVTIRTEASMQDITVARLQSTRVQTPLSPLF